MHTAEIDALGKAAYANKLRPGGVQELGADVQVWAAHLSGYHAKKSDKYLTLSEARFFNGDQEIILTPDDLGTPGPFGFHVKHFVATLFGKIRHTAKTRIILVCYGTAENYGVLDVHDLDPDIVYHPAGGDSYSLKYRTLKHNLEFTDLAVWFGDMTLSEVLTALNLHEDTQTVKNVWAVLRATRGTLLSEFKIDLCKYRTPASAAARIYVNEYLQHAPGGKFGLPKRIRYQAMLSYWGGRAEAFSRGKFDGVHSMYDAVSLYPNAVINLGTLPRLTDWRTMTDYDLTHAHAGICTVEFDFRKIDAETGEIDETEPELHPCLPVQLVDKTVYPLHGISHCTLHEARYALEIGARVRVINGYCYNAGRGDKSLADFSRALLAKKQAADDAGDKAGRTVYKSLMNALYGKFGQHRTEGYDLETMRSVCRQFGYPNLAVLNNVSNWPEMARAAGMEFAEELMTGGQWCPEWAALIQGYARYIESKAMRDTTALVGTTDSVLVPGDLGESFEVEGITFKRECTGQRAVIVRSRLYVLASRQGHSWNIEKCALHGAPNIAGMPEHLLFWQVGEEEIKVQAVRVRKLREGLFAGEAVGAKLGGKKQTVTHTVSMRWDEKRVQVGDYSVPLTAVELPDEK